MYGISDVGPKSSGPSWNLEYIKDHLGVTDPDQDAQVEAAMRVAMAFVEKYCNRYFEYRENYVEYVRHVRGEGVQLHLWPFAGDIIANDQGGVVIAKWPYMSHPIADPISGGNIGYSKAGHWADSQTGIVWWSGYTRKEPLFFEYNGGYTENTWPADLLMVLMNTVSNAWDMFSNSSSVEAGAISKMTVPDVGTIHYNVGGGDSNAGGSGALGPISGADSMILDFYRLQEC